MSWLPIAIFSLILAAVSNILQSALTRRSKADIFTLSTLYIGLSYTMLVLLAIYLGELDFIAARDAWWLILLNVLVYPAAHLIAFKSLKLIDDSLYIIIFSSWVLFAILGATFILDEGITSTQWIGLLLILSGVVVAHSAGKKSKTTARGITFAAIAAVLYGVGGVIDKPLFDATGINTFLLVGSGSTTVAMIIIYIVHQKRLKKPLMPKVKSVSWHLLFAGTAVLTLAIATYYFALDRLDNISHLNAVNTFSIILTVILGIIVLKERQFVRTKLVAAAIATIGFLLVI